MSLLVGEVFKRAAMATPRAPAVSLSDRTLTFGELDERANRIGQALRRSGIERGDRVAWWGPTTLDAVPMFAALAKIGAAFAPLNSGLAPEEALAVLGKARPALLVSVGGEHVETARALCNASGVGLAWLEGDGVRADVDLGQTALASLPAEDPTDEELEEGDSHVIFFTSGSTGAPKGVVLSHRANYLRTFPPNAAAGRGATVCMFPLFHMAAWTLALGCWQVREEIVLVERADPRSLLQAAARRRARRIYLIPAVWERVLDELRGPSAGRLDVSSLEEADTGTSATPPELLSAISAALPSTTTRVMYGSTEAGPATSLAPGDLERKPGSVGLPSFNVELRLSDEGEVCVRSDFLMDGYFDDPEATASALRDGWYHTGDLGQLDSDGYLYVVGRARDVIRTGGETVSPSEVEGVLASLEQVADVVVVGLPDDSWGEIVCAVVVPSSGASPDLEYLRSGCEGRLASFKQPRRLELVSSIPRTPATGQAQRTLILQRLGLSRG